MKKLFACLLFFTIFLTSCSLNEPKSKNELEEKNPNLTSTENSNDNYGQKDIEEDSSCDNKASNNNKQNPKSDSKEKKAVETPKKQTSSSKNSVKDENIREKVINYIINGQSDKKEAKKLKWSKSFLNEVDIESSYNQFIKKGGSENDLEKFAEYITLNAPVPKEWEKLFKKDLNDKYGEEVVKLEHLEGDLYQAYIKKDGKEVPYVVVSSRTGYFHG